MIGHLAVSAPSLLQHVTNAHMHMITNLSLIM